MRWLREDGEGKRDRLISITQIFTVIFERPVVARVGDRGKLVAIALLALLGCRQGRMLLKRVVVGVFFVYDYLVIVILEVIAGILLLFFPFFLVIAGYLVLAEVATHLIPPFTSTKADRGGSATSNSAPNTSSNYGSNRTTTSNDGSNQTGPRRGGQRQQEAMRNHLQRLTMAAAAADTREANMALSLHQRERLTIEYRERNRTTLAVTAFNSGSNSQATAASPKARVTSRQTPSNPDLSTIVASTSQYQRNHGNPTERPSRGLQEPGQSVVIHLELPIYVCDLIFWNDIHITLPSLSPPSSLSSGATAANNGSHGDASDAAGLFYHIEMQMWMELNRDLVANIGTRNGKKPCKDCLMGSHSVGKRQFDCTYLDGCLDVRKNSFHAGRKLTILGSNSELNFKFKTALHQTLARPNTSGPGAVQQRATLALCWHQGQSSSGRQMLAKVDGGSTPKRHRGSRPGLLAAVFRSSNGTSAFTPVIKCSGSVEKLYSLEDRRLMTKENCINSQLGTGQSGLDGRLFGSTIASSN